VGCQALAHRIVRAAIIPVGAAAGGILLLFAVHQVMPGLMQQLVDSSDSTRCSVQHIHSFCLRQCLHRRWCRAGHAVHRAGADHVAGRGRETMLGSLRARACAVLAETAPSR
jgi:hypothetical protein